MEAVLRPMSGISLNNTVSSKSPKAVRPTIVEKRAPGTLGRPVEVNTNITPLTLEKDISYYKYDLRMSAVFTKVDGSEGVKEFSKLTKDDYNEQERKKACVEIFLHLVDSEETFKGNLIYDRASLLYSTEKLDGVTKAEKLFKLPATVQSVCPDANRVEVAIKQAADTSQITSNDLSIAANAEFKGGSKDLVQVLNLATSQIPFFTPSEFITYGDGNIYLLDPSRAGFHQNEAPTIGNDKFVGVGLAKGIKILEGMSESGEKEYMPALVLDVKKTAFHFDNQNLSEKILAMHGPDPSNAVLKRDLSGLRCLTTHKRASVVIGGFTHGPIGLATFTDKEGNIQSIVKYYEDKYDAKITHRDLPGVIEKVTRNVYPTDILIVAPNQRVKAKQQTREVVDTLIRVSATKPDIRFQQTQRLAQLLQLNSANMQALGVSVPANQPPLVVPARQLGPVGLLGGIGTMAGPSWRGAPKFVVGAGMHKWAAFLFHNSYSSRNQRDPSEVFRRFLCKFSDAANSKGMVMPQTPSVTEEFLVRDGHTTKTVDPLVAEAVEKAKDAGCDFVLFVSDERIKTHDPLKHNELVHRITTQEVTLAKAAQVAFEGKVQTMENIIMKTNAKMRGMNHVLAGDGGLHHTPTAMIMGIFVQQPRSLTLKEMEAGAQPSMPAVIGLSANNGNLQSAPPAQREMSAQQYFTACWRYANPREWEAGETQRDTLKKMVIESLLQFKRNRGRVPEQVIVYRGGVSEGQLPYIASTERDVFHDAFASINAAYRPALVIIAASKEHNERFFHKVFPSGAPGQRVDSNLPPGLIVDRVAVNPEMNEFYLQSHKALQGTAKATKYSLLHESTGKITNDQIQQMTHALCHLHEIVNSTTSIPTPLYVAEESAKRAVNLYQHVKGSSDTFDIFELNKTLALEKCASRVNA